MSLSELVIAMGVSAIVMSLAVSPLIQNVKMRVGVDFQTQFEMEHLLAMQKARNPRFVRERVGITTGCPAACATAPAVDACFAGRGAGCAAHARDNVLLETNPIGSVGGGGVTGSTTIRMSVDCVATSCSEVRMDVATVQTANPNGAWLSRPLRETVIYQAKMLSSRTEIDFSDCVGKAITGINFDTLTAQCVPFGGNSTCQAQAGSGPLRVFGQPAAPENCIEPVNDTCATGVAEFGLAGGQAKCASGMECLDPFSTNCTGPVACVENWQPDPATICLGTSFIQSSGCPSNPNRNALGTKNCAAESCSMSGGLSWPDSNLGPCTQPLIRVTAEPNTSAIISNNELGYKGTAVVACKDNSGVPAPNDFDLAGAIKTCEPVTCPNVPATVSWSCAGLKSGTPGPGLDAVGPWPCSGPVTFTQTPAQAAGVLLAAQADVAARASASNTAAGVSAGAITIKCNDAGPVTDNGRVGSIYVAGVSCGSGAVACRPGSSSSGGGGCNGSTDVCPVDNTTPCTPGRVKSPYEECALVPNPTGMKGQLVCNDAGTAFDKCNSTGICIKNDHYMDHVDGVCKYAVCCSGGTGYNPHGYSDSGVPPTCPGVYSSSPGGTNLCAMNDWPALRVGELPVEDWPMPSIVDLIRALTWPAASGAPWFIPNFQAFNDTRNGKAWGQCMFVGGNPVWHWAGQCRDAKSTATCEFGRWILNSADGSNTCQFEFTTALVGEGQTVTDSYTADDGVASIGRAQGFCNSRGAWDYTGTCNNATGTPSCPAYGQLVEDTLSPPNYCQFWGGPASGGFTITVNADLNPLDPTRKPGKAGLKCEASSTWSISCCTCNGRACDGVGKPACP